MKTSIKLLLGLLLLIVGGLFYAKYELKQDYETLDFNDPFIGFEKISGLDFSHVNIVGGNRSHLYIEPADANNLLIEKGGLESITYEINNDTLQIVYSDSYTQDPTSNTNYWGTRERCSVIIQYNSVKSIVARDASIGMELDEQPAFKTHLYGMSNLELFTNLASLKELSIASHDNSKHRINSRDGIDKLAYLNIALTDQSLAELHRISVDSSNIQLDSSSRISADAHFFKN